MLVQEPTNISHLNPALAPPSNMTAHTKKPASEATHHANPFNASGKFDACVRQKLLIQINEFDASLHGASPQSRTTR
jgi:hypothetical protein